MVEPHTLGNFDLTLNGKSLLHSDHVLPSNLSIAVKMRLPMWMSVLVEIVGTCMISAVVAMFWVWEERNWRTQSMSDGSLGTSLKIHGLQPKVIIFTP